MKSADKGYAEIEEKVKPYISPDMNVLELACGTGQLSFWLAEYAKK